MATPKKKVSKARRNMRRFSCAYELDPVTWTKDGETGEPVRPHRVTVATSAAYVAARKAKKAAKGKAAQK